MGPFCRSGVRRRDRDGHADIRIPSGRRLGAGPVCGLDDVGTPQPVGMPEGGAGI